LIKALKAGQAMNRAIVAWPKGTPVPKEVAQATKAVKDLSLAILDLFPQTSEARAKLQGAVLRVYEALVPFLQLLSEGGVQ
jgi:hypothetical protein